MSADLEQSLAALAAYGIETGSARGSTQYADHRWLHGNSLQRHRLVGLAGACLRDEAPPESDQSVTTFIELEDAWHRHALRMERLLAEVSGVLDKSGVSYRVIKGPSLAHTVYDEPEHRSFGDLDILVPGSQLAETRRSLVNELGAKDMYPELRPGFDAEFAKDVLIRLDGAEIDLHRTLAAGPFGLRIPVDELFDSSVDFELGDRSYKTLPPVPTFLQVCYNAALGDVPPRLMSLRDVAQVHYALAPPLNEVLETADRWGGAAVVARAVSLAWDTLSLEPAPISGWAASYEPSQLDRLFLSASVSQSRSYTRHLAALLALRGVGARWRYVRGIVAPSSDYLEARGWTQRSHLKRAYSRLRPRRS